MTTPHRSFFLLSTTVALALLTAGTAAPASASRASARQTPRAHGTSYRPLRARTTDPATSTVGPRADFNGDGFGDLAIGVPGEGVGTHGNAGGVNVLYGTGSGLSSTGNQFWSQASQGVLGVAETDDGFGSATAVGDFNQDGFSDLAVGVPYEGIGSIADAGGVNILYGSGSGLTSAGNQFWSQSTQGIQGTAQADDELGLALASRDYNGDGYADLAIGVPGEAGDGFGSEGAITVLYGSGGGLTAKHDQLINGEAGDGRFGAALAAGDFDGDGKQDLAIGAPDAKNGGHAAAGMVLELIGTAHGLKFLTQTANETPEKGAHCGHALASYNVNNDSAGYADVAAGCPNASYEQPDQGGVEIHLGSSSGLHGAEGHYEAPLVGADTEFGTSLAAADLGRDSGGGHDDLLVGEPLIDSGGGADSGLAYVIYESTAGATFQEIAQGLDGTKGVPEAGDIFGAAVTTGNFDGDGWGDIAIGVPGERVGSAGGAGGVNVLYGSSGGITGTGNQFWSQDTDGIVGTAEPEDFFADALTGRAG